MLSWGIVLIPVLHGMTRIAAHHTTMHLLMLDGINSLLMLKVHQTIWVLLVLVDAKRNALLLL